MPGRTDRRWIVRTLLLALTALPACVSEYETTTLDGFDRAAINGENVALNLPGTEGSDIWLFDGAQLNQLTFDDTPKLSFTLQISKRWVGWAEYTDGIDIMGYDLWASQSRDVSHTQPQSEDPFFALADDRFAWKILQDSPSEYDFVVSDGFTNTVINEASNDGYYGISQDPETSAGNAAYGAYGIDPNDGSTDSEVFYYDGSSHTLVQVTNEEGNGREDGPALISGKHVAFRSTSNVGPYQIKLYDAQSGQTTVPVQAGQTIVGGGVLDDAFGAYPIEFSSDLLVWNGALADGPYALLTNVATGETRNLDDVAGGSVNVVATSQGYVGMMVIMPDTTIAVVVYQPATGTLTTVATYAPGFATNGVLSMSGANLAYYYIDPSDGSNKVAIHLLRTHPPA